MNFLRSLDREEITYWIGLGMLFIGLSVSVSIATALIVTGAAMALESVITSYLATWIGTQSVRK